MKALHILCILPGLFSVQLNAAAIYVSPAGTGDGKSTESSCSLSSAIVSLRSLTPAMQEDLAIHLMGGRYELTQTIVLTEQESGKNGHRVIIKAADNSRPVISGGRKIEGWQGPDQNGIYSADVPDGVTPRMLYANGKRLIRSRYPNTHLPGIFPFMLPGGNSGSTGYIQQKYPCDAENKRIDIGRQGAFLKPTSLHKKWDTVREVYDALLDRSDMAKAKKERQDAFRNIDFVSMLMGLKNKSDVELFIRCQNSVTLLKIDRIEKEGRSQWVYPIEPHAPDVFFHRGAVSSNAPFHLENAYRFIDLEGEWCFDSSEQKVYLKAGESPQQVYASKVERLLVLSGASNIVIDGILFEHSAFARPETFGHKSRLGGLYRQARVTPKDRGAMWSEERRQQDGGREIFAWTVGAVELENSRNLCFRNNVFRHLDGNGMVLIKGTVDIEISGNVFHEIGDSGMIVQAAQEPCPLPGDEVKNILVKNNIFSKMGTQVDSGMSIFAAFPIALRIEHNEFLNNNGWAINVGWSVINRLPETLRDNTIRNNLFRNVIRSGSDCGVIHTKSNPAEGVHTLIEGNFVDEIDNSFYMKYYKCNPATHSQVFYLDDGTDKVIGRNNVIGKVKGRVKLSGSYNRYRDINRRRRQQGLPRIKDTRPPKTNRFEKAKRHDRQIEEEAGLQPEYEKMRRLVH